MKQLKKEYAALPLMVGMLAVSSLQLNAQTTPPATCTTAPLSVTNLSIERVLSLSNLLATKTPTIPANILASIAAGAQEVRSRLIYNPQQSTVTDTTFVVAAGSPLPTPLTLDVSGQTIASFVLNIGQVLISCIPAPNILVTGTVSNSTGALANLNGAEGAISLGYSTATPLTINNVVELIAGQVVAYSASAQGSLTFPAAPVTPPGSNNGGPTVVVVPNVPLQGAGITQVNVNPFHLDATGSTDPGNLALTYAWTSDKPINFQPTNAAATNAVFQSGPGDYTVTLTVTNSAGISSSVSFVLEYINK